MSEIVASAAPPTVDPRLRELRRIAIVPALNEEHSIGRVIDELHAFDPGLDVVVVDDGSVDATSQVAAAKGARVLRLPFNLGIGGAVQTGFRYAFEQGYDIAVRVDGDGQHDPAQLGRVLEPVLRGDADIAVGSRFAADGATGYRSSRSRRIGILLLAWIVSRIVGRRVMLRLIRAAEIARGKTLKGTSPISRARPTSPRKSAPPSARSRSGKRSEGSPTIAAIHSRRNLSPYP